MAWISRHRIALRDTGVALGFFLVLLALTRLSFPPVQIPGYLLIMGFDAPQHALSPGLGGVAYQALFGLYLVGLAAVAGRLASRLRGRFGPAGRLRYGLAGGVLAVILILLAAAVVILVPNVRQLPTPVVLAGAIGLAGLWMGTRLAAWRESSG